MLDGLVPRGLGLRADVVSRKLAAGRGLVDANGHDRCLRMRGHPTLVIGEHDVGRVVPQELASYDLARARLHLHAVIHERGPHRFRYHPHV